jgi:anhydro-N-acetylmuramic acid kinase
MVLAIGMNSGSSFDRIDVALIDVDPAPDGAPTRPRFVTGLTHPWPATGRSPCCGPFGAN